MIRKKSEMRGPIVIDTTGPAGNAFALIGTAKRLMKELGYDINKQESVIKRMMNGDYQNLLRVMDKELGDYIILEVADE